MNRSNFTRQSLLLCALVLVASSFLSAQTYTELLSFNGNSAAGPNAPMTQGIDGNLYGTTNVGGTGACRGGAIGCGVIFSLTRTGDFKILYNFPTTDDGPVNSLVVGPDGSFYGETQDGYGNIYRITPAGSYTTVYSFMGGLNGSEPSPLTLGSDGNFYGATSGGGTPSNSCPYGCGTVFKMTPAGSLATLYSFCPQNYCPDGESPYGPLALAPDGNFYGTTLGGGLYKQGTIFKITADGTFTLLHTIDSDVPDSTGFILASDGNLYGRSGYGIYRFTLQGVITVLPGNLDSYAFMQASDGNFYGTAPSGAHGLGQIFQMPITGNFTDLYGFSGYPTDGSNPFGGVVQRTDGKFYGQTYTGGSAPCNYGGNPGCGTLYSLDMGLPPMVAFVRGIGRVGQSFGILGQGLTGTTSILVNGVPATFSVKSDTLIVTSVPAGATSGYVTVTTPSGNLTSNAPFWVLP